MPSKNTKRTPAKPVKKKPVAAKVASAKKPAATKAKPAVSAKAKPAASAKAKVAIKAKVAAKAKTVAPVKTKSAVTAKAAIKAKVAAKAKTVAPVKAKSAVTAKAKTGAAVKAQPKTATPAKTKSDAPSKASPPVKASKGLLSLPATILPVPLPPPPPIRIKPMAGANQKLSQQDLSAIRLSMVHERARLTGNITELHAQSLVRHDEINAEEDGTDAFIRLQDLDRASSDQEIIAKIDTALRAIDEGIYGLCERCGNRIESPRLRALPFVKMCIKCQSETEGGHNGKISVRHLLWE